jgi:hypothetical protein
MAGNITPKTNKNAVFPINLATHYTKWYAKQSGKFIFVLLDIWSHRDSSDNLSLRRMPNKNIVKLPSIKWAAVDIL